MNLCLEVHVDIPPDELHDETVARLTRAFAEVLIEQGYGNEGSEAETVLRSLVVARLETVEDEVAFLRETVEGAIMMVFPASDEDFLQQALDRGAFPV